MKITGQVNVQRPPSEVFPLWGALERSGEYLEGFQRIRQTDGPIGVGTKWKAIDKWPGRTVEFTVEMIEWQPSSSMAARFSEPMTGGWRATFVPAGDSATDVTMELELRPSGIMGLIAPLTKPWAGRQTQKFLTSFKEWAERQPAAEEG